MKRQILNVPQGQDLIRTTIRIEDDPGAGEGQEGFRALGMLLQTVAQQPYLLQQLSDCPREVHIRHNDQAWVIEAISYSARPREA